MGWDSNPRYAFTHAGFQDRCLQPLGHPSSNSLSDIQPYLSIRDEMQGVVSGNVVMKAVNTKTTMKTIVKALLTVVDSI